MSAYSTAVLADSPVAYWELDETSGNVASSVGSFTSTTVSGAVQNVAGRIGNGVEFDGTDDYINFAHDAALSFGTTGAFTVSAWIRPDRTHRGVIVSKGPNHEWKVYLSLGGDNQLMNLTAEVREGGNNRIYGGTVDLANLVGSWVHVAVTFSGANTRARFYVNGVLDVERTTVSSFSTGTRAVRIGSTDSGVDFFDGRIDEVALWDSELTGEQIAAHYAARDGADPVWPQVAWQGAVTDDGATVAVELSAAADVRLGVSTSASFTSPTYTTLQESVSRAKLAITGLDPATTYYWFVEVDGVPNYAVNGTFTTFPTAGSATSFSFAVATCAGSASAPYTSNHGVFSTIAGLDVALFLHLGDLHYADPDSTDADDHRQNYRNVLANSRQKALYRTIPLAYAWSNHDLATYDAAGTDWRAPALTAYRDMVPHYPTMTGDPDDTPIAQTFVCGRVRFVLLDIHTDRTTSTRFLSSAQMSWLDDILATAEERLLVLCVQSAWIGGSGEEAWSFSGSDRATIAAKLVTHGWAGRTLILHGDAHQIALDDGTNSQYDPDNTDPGPVVACFAPLDRSNSNKGGPYSEGVADQRRGQFGVVTVAEQEDGTIDVTLTGYSTATASPFTVTTSPEGVGPLTFTVEAAPSPSSPGRPEPVSFGPSFRPSSRLAWY